MLRKRAIERDAAENGRSNSTGRCREWMGAIVRDAVGNGREQSVLGTRAIVRDAVRN